MCRRSSPLLPLLLALLGRPGEWGRGVPVVCGAREGTRVRRRPERGGIRQELRPAVRHTYREQGWDPAGVGRTPLTWDPADMGPL